MLIDIIELVDKLLKILNIVFDVAFKESNLFHFCDLNSIIELDYVFADDIEIVDNNVALFDDVENLDTFNDDNNVILLFNVVVAE